MFIYISREPASPSSPSPRDSIGQGSEVLGHNENGLSSFTISWAQLVGQEDPLT